VLVCITYLMIDLRTCQAIPRRRSTEGPDLPLLYTADSDSGIWESRDLGRHDHIDNQVRVAPLLSKRLARVCKIVSDFLLY
jgi:hypothetical protein